MTKLKEPWTTVDEAYLTKGEIRAREERRLRSIAGEASYAQHMYNHTPGTYGGAEREGNPKCPHLNRKATGFESFILWLLGD